MIDRWSERISRYMAGRGVIKDDDCEVAAYGLYLLLADAVQIGILLVVALLFDIVLPMLVFSVFYSALRRNMGGAHASSLLRCIVIYTLTAFLAVHTGLLIPMEYGRYGAMVLALFTVMVVFTRNPMAHPNNPKSDKAVRKFTKQGRAVAIAECAIIIAAGLLAPPSIAHLTHCAALGSGIAAVVLLMPAGLKERGDKNEHS